MVLGLSHSPPALTAQNRFYALFSSAVTQTTSPPSHEVLEGLPGLPVSRMHTA
jgi:hypothetical protein